MRILTFDSKITEKSVMLVDASLVQTFINRKTIQELSEKIRITHYKAPFFALRFLINHQNNLDLIPDVILMDINLPKKEIEYFLKQFSLFSNEVKTKCKIHLISLAFNQEDREWLKNISLVSSCIEKPLITDHCIEILSREY